MFHHFCSKTKHMCKWLFRFSKRMLVLLVISLIAFLVLMFTGMLFEPPVWAESIIGSALEAGVESTVEK